MVSALKTVKPMYFNLIAGFIILIGTFFGLFGKQIQDKNSSEKSDKILKTGEATQERVEVLKNQNDNLLERLGNQAQLIDSLRIENTNRADEEAKLQGQLREKSEELTQLYKKLSAPLPKEVIVRYELDFDIKLNKLEFFENITQDALQNHKDKLSGYGPDDYIELPSFAKNHANNPFVDFKTLRFYVEFKKNSNDNNGINFGGPSKMTFFNQENFDFIFNRLQARQDYLEEELADFESATLHLSYSQKKRKFKVACFGKVFPLRFNPGQMSMYDLKGTVMKVYCMPALTYGVTNSFTEHPLFELARVRIKALNYFQFDFYNFNRKTQVDSQSPYYYERFITESDLSFL